MKKILVLIAILFLAAGFLKAQPPAAINLANHIAKKMKDTLNLTGLQRTQVYGVNIALHNWKMAVREQYSNPDSLRIKIQRIERKRDSLYHIILPEPKYILYLQKKRNLVSAN